MLHNVGFVYDRVFFESVLLLIMNAHALLMHELIVFEKWRQKHYRLLVTLYSSERKLKSIKHRFLPLL